MSYILEALKKSQHERELGQAPTLVPPNFPSEEKRARPNLWILVALILATSAVVIALYSALRGGPPVATVAQTAQTATRETRDRDPATPKQPATKPLPRQASLRQPGPVASGPRGSANRFPAHAPVAPETTASSVAMGAPAPHVPPPPPQRRMHKGPVAAEEPPMAPTQERDGKIPPDLIADIEAFKREVREGQAGMTEASRVEEETAPRDLRLPKAVRNRLPRFVMSAHIYDSEPSRRFVLINGLKTGEGEVSREGIAVERILPDGAVLSFEGHRFFRRR
ncbi:general secretion pathway protein GspB [Candidatus Thiosymbion oneisti]|uniref:general secretion pathway protein GspB n=1 Tax=Candidatus Thiosymbion oneisti TaxID=589554 RepID=UPI000AC05139|nr:general secretion pathway protein GspB [Candidatus Thiosymbion oneisti]